MTNATSVQPAIELIVNVDDLGLHPAVRRAVEECGAAGTVTSASALANGPDQDALRPSYPGISLGAHLNIVRGAPLSPSREVRSLVGENGLFLGSFAALAARALRGGIVRSEVRLEWSRQVAHLRARGLALSHLDSEQHAHHLPGLFGVACDVAREHGIAWVRRSDERFGGLRLGIPALRRAVLRVLAARADGTRGGHGGRGVGHRRPGRALHRRCLRAGAAWTGIHAPWRLRARRPARR